MSVHPIALDDFDHRLLELLQRDAAVTLTTLGDAVGLSASAVQRRITRYRRHGLLRQVAVLDPNALPATTLAAVVGSIKTVSARLGAKGAGRPCVWMVSPVSVIPGSTRVMSTTQPRWLRLVPTTNP